MKSSEAQITSVDSGNPKEPGANLTSHSNASGPTPAGNSSASQEPVESGPAPEKAAAGSNPAAKTQPDTVIISVADVSKALEEQGILPLPGIVQNISHRLRRHMNKELVWQAYKDWRKPHGEPAVK